MPGLPVPAGYGGLWSTVGGSAREEARTYLRGVPGILSVFSVIRRYAKIGGGPPWATTVVTPYLLRIADGRAAH